MATMFNAGLCGCHEPDKGTAKGHSAPGTEVADQAEAAKPLRVNDRAPGATLRRPDGEPVDMVSLYKNKPSILVFYRGGWCPYCNTHLGQIVKAEPELVAMGYQVLAISPDRPEALGETVDQDARLVQRQALAGMIWNKQFYHYDIPDWLDGDPAQPAPPPERRQGRNAEWLHLNNADVISMPDKWEYPWYAAWDLAFHCIPCAMMDSDFAKHQLDLLTREWYMHPNGQLPAYEWAFGDVNPPVHAWATWRVFQIDRKQRGDPR